MATEHPIIKFLQIPLLALTNAVSIALFCLLNDRFTGRLPHLVARHRDITTIIVQVSASILAASQVYVLCTLINFASRLRAFQRFISARSLGLLAALSVPRMDWDLPWYSIAITGIFTLIGPFLGAVWAGALTPLVANSMQQDGEIQIPQYTGPVQADWSLNPGGTIYLRDCQTYYFSPSIPISYCPVVGHTTTLLSTAQSATSAANTTRIYPKIEVPTWNYRNRSYGVGASQGLFPPTLQNNASYSTYSYEEPGYFSQVTCQYNVTSNLSITSLGTSEDGLLALWQVDGSLPNTVASDKSSYPLTTINSLWADELLGWSAAAAHGRNMLAMATASTGHWYPWWNAMQCSVDFLPTNFTVTVNLNDSTIDVAPRNPTTHFERTDTLKEVIMANLDLISRMSSHIGISSLGAALGSNANVLKASYPSMTPNETYRRRAENMIGALIDDLLVGEATKQMIVNGSSRAVPVYKQFDAVRLGSPRFIYISMATNILLVLIVLVEAFRTKAWHDLPTFNITTLQSIIAAALLSPSSGHSDREDVSDNGFTPTLTGKILKQARFKWTHENFGEAVMLVELSTSATTSSGIVHDSESRESFKARNTSVFQLGHLTSESQESLFNVPSKPVAITTTREPSFGGGAHSLW